MTATKLGPPGMERVEKEEEEEGERLLTFTGSQATPPLRGGRRGGELYRRRWVEKKEGEVISPSSTHLSSSYPRTVGCLQSRETRGREK